MRSPADDLRARAADLEAAGAQHLARARRMRELAAEIDALGEDPPVVLTSDEDTTNIPKVADDAEMSRSFLAGRGRSEALKRKVPFIVALYYHPNKKKRMSAAEWGRLHKVPQPTVSAWAQPPGAVSARPIPQKWALHFFKEYGVPMNEHSWPNGIIGGD